MGRFLWLRLVFCAANSSCLSFNATWEASKSKGVNRSCCSWKTSALGRVILCNCMNGFVKLIGKQIIEIYNSSVSVLTWLVFKSSPLYQLNSRHNNVSWSVALISSLSHLPCKVKCMCVKPDDDDSCEILSVISSFKCTVRKKKRK